MPNSKRRVLVISNSNWNIMNFRKSFISFLSRVDSVFVGSFEGQKKLDLDNVYIVNLYDIGRNKISLYNIYCYLKSLYKGICKNEIQTIYVFTLQMSVITVLLKFLPSVKRIYIQVVITGLGKLYTSNNIFLNICFHIGLFFLNKANRIIVQNRSDYEVLRRVINSNKICIVLGSGVSLENTEKEPKTFLKDESIVFCYVGRFLKSKGLDIIVSAFEAYVKDFPRDKLLIVGNYDSNDSGFRIISDVGQIKLMGWSSDVREIFSKSHVTLLMSDREGMPKTLLESLSNRTPIIAFCAPGVRDIYDCAGANSVGIRVEERNAQSLLLVLQRFRTIDKLEYLTMCNNGRVLVEEVFSEEVINVQLRI